MLKSFLAVNELVAAAFVVPTRPFVLESRSHSFFDGPHQSPLDIPLATCKENKILLLLTRDGLKASQQPFCDPLRATQQGNEQDQDRRQQTSAASASGPPVVILNVVVSRPSSKMQSHA